MRLSIENRLEKAEKKNRKTKELTARDIFLIEYRMTQAKFGFDVDGLGAMELSAWTRVLGAKKMKEIEKNMVEKERLAAKVKQTTIGWERLRQQTI